MKPNAVAANRPVLPIMAPTREQLESAVRSTVESREPLSTQLKAPVKNPERYVHFNLTEPGTADRIREAYLIKGRIWVKETGFAGIPTWNDYGPAPLF